MRTVSSRGSVFGSTRVATLPGSLLTLTYAQTTTATATYRYSGDGLGTTTVTPTSGTTYAAQDVLGSRGLGAFTGTFTSGALTSQTIYVPGTDDPIAQTTSSGTCFLHEFGAGSVTSVTNVSQGLQSSYLHDPYGDAIQDAGPVSSPYRCAGGQWDAGPGPAYDRARFYDPTTGRFLSPDPLGGGYAYAGDNPTSYKDPSGMMFARPPGGGSYAEEMGGHGLQISNYCPSSLETRGFCIPSNPAAQAWFAGTGYTGAPGGPAALAAGDTTGGLAVGGGGGQGYNWGKCGSPDSLFVTGILLGLLGLDLDLFPESQLQGFASTLASFDTFATDIRGIVSGGGGLLAWVGAIFDMGWWLFWNVVINVLAWWMAGMIGLKVALDFTGPGLAIDLVGFSIGTAAGFAGLVAQGCV